MPRGLHILNNQYQESGDLANTLVFRWERLYLLHLIFMYVLNLHPTWSPEVTQGSVNEALGVMGVNALGTRMEVRV